MRRAQKLATAIAAAMMVSAMSAPVSFAADNAFSIDELNWTDKDWQSIAMTNDDTVDTGAVIRSSADADSKATGYLYRGAAVQVVDKGEEWTEVKSGKVTGFIRNEFLAYGDEARGLAAHYGKQGIIANWNDVNVFSANDADSEITTQLRSGVPMSMLEDNGHWIAVQRGADSAGFVSEEDVTRVLLVDTAIPADGEDVEDIPATMTAADVKTAAPARTASYMEASEDTDAGTASYAENSEGADAGTASYAEDTADDAGSQLYYLEGAENTYVESSGDESAYTDDSYTEDPSSQGYTDDPAASAQENYDNYTQEQSQAADTLTTQSVSDDAQVQALYDAYVNAQNAAMDCTSEEDAQTKANAAIEAWNAYVAACGDSSAAVSASTTADTAYTAEDATATTADTAYTAEDATSTTGDTAYTTEDTTSAADTSNTADSSYTETAQVENSTASSGGNAYGNYSDVDLLAAIIWCEAGNQSYDGMVAVGQVVMNRVASPSFPNTISEVLNQPGQFTPASAGTLQAALAAGVNSTCYAAAQDAMGGAAPVPGYPLYFNTHSGSYQLGAHYFS